MYLCYYRDDAQLSRISKVIFKMKKSGISFSEVNYSFLKQYLKPIDILLFYEMLVNGTLSKLDITSRDLYGYDINKNKSKNEIITPYTILKIEEKEYSKEELLNLISRRINYVKNHIIDEVEQQSMIDMILDAYNDIISSKQIKK